MMKIAPPVDPQRIDEQIREAAQGLEAAFVRQMLDAMEKAQLEEGFFGSSAGAKTRHSHFQMVLSELLAENEPLGLADQIREELTQQIKDGTNEKTAAPLPDWFNIFRWEAKELLLGAEEDGG